MLIAILAITNIMFSQTPEVKSKSKVKIIKADEGTSHPLIANTHVLSGNVIFEHDSTLMYCDSAYFYLDSNAFQAFSNVRVIRGDSIKLTGDTLFYRGKQKSADLKGKVNYQDRTMTLTTKALHYDFNLEQGSYNSLAIITSKTDKNTLASNKGIYDSKSQTMFFKDSVRLTNQEYSMQCDTLVYKSDTKFAYFHGPTHIISKENTIYCEKGIYDTEKEVSDLWKMSKITTKEQSIAGDSIHYDRTKGVGKLYGNVIFIDTTNKVNLYGNYAYHNEKKDTTSIVGNAQMNQFNEKDTLYLKAGYLSIKTDSTNTNKRIKAYRKVSIYKSDFQASCDSLSYSDVDSLMKFFIKPILWSGENQITGKYIEAKTGKESIERLDVIKDAFIISEVDTVMYNQIKGRDIHAFFVEGKLSKVDVLGNGQTLYFIQNEDSIYLEANQAKCASLTVSFEKEEISMIKFVDTPIAKYSAITSLGRNEKYFEGFDWLILNRPILLDFIK